MAVVTRVVAIVVVGNAIWPAITENEAKKHNFTITNQCERYHNNAEIKAKETTNKKHYNNNNNITTIVHKPLHLIAQRKKKVTT